MNLFFRNLGDWRFEEVALAAGLGFNEEGRAEAGMGVDVADYDGNGTLDLFVTNYEAETNTMYQNLGDGSFIDATYQTGLAVPSLPWVGFGTNFFDMENDGDPDILRGQRPHHGITRAFSRTRRATRSGISSTRTMEDSTRTSPRRRALISSSSA